MTVKNFFLNTACGAAIGLSVIIPGISGGTIAVLLNVYDKIIDAINGLRRNFKASILFLLPILLGVVLSVAALIFPIEYALSHAPFPTVMLFTGLMAGSFPKILKDGIKKGFKELDTIAIILPFIFIICICVLANIVNIKVDLSSSMPVYGYFLLILIGIVGSCALVVPGVSGSLILLILGYYQPILDTAKSLFSSFGHSVLVLALFGVGIIIGFFSIAKLMKLFLTKFPRGTFWAIIGFIIGSFPAIFLTYNINCPDHPYSSLDGVQIAAGALLFIAGILAAYAFTAYVEGKQAKNCTLRKE